MKKVTDIIENKCRKDHTLLMKLLKIQDYRTH